MRRDAPRRLDAPREVGLDDGAHQEQATRAAELAHQPLRQVAAVRIADDQRRLELARRRGRLQLRAHQLGQLLDEVVGRGARHLALRRAVAGKIDVQPAQPGGGAELVEGLDHDAPIDGEPVDQDRRRTFAARLVMHHSSPTACSHH